MRRKTLADPEPGRNRQHAARKTMRAIRRPILFIGAMLTLQIALAQPAAAQQQPPIRPYDDPTAGVAIAADHPAAVKAAWEILREGGTATDAAIAAALTLSVVMPEAASIAGAATALRYDAAKRQISAYVGREISSAATAPDWMIVRALPATPKIHGGRAVGAPTMLQMLARLKQDGARLDWSILAKNAEAIAREGFPMTASAVKAFKVASFPVDGGVEHIFRGRDAAVAGVGAIIRNPGLAEVLSAVGRDGGDVLAGGIIASAIVDGVARATRGPAKLMLEELANAKPIVAAPACVVYHAAAVCAPPQPTLGPATLQTIALFDRAAPENPSFLMWAHVLTQAHRLAMTDVRRYLADPAMFPNFVAELLTPQALNQRARRIHLKNNPGLPGSSRIAGIPLGLQGATPRKRAAPSASVIVVDNKGDAVAISMTLSRPYGAGLAVRGVVLNSANSDFEPIPEREGFQIANQIGPSKRPRLNLAPVMALDQERRLILAVTAGNGEDTPAFLAKATIAALAFGKSARDAVGAPNISSADRRTKLERRTAAERLNAPMTDLGHLVSDRPMPSGLLMVRRNGENFDAVADGRGNGVAKATPLPPKQAGALDLGKRGS